MATTTSAGQSATFTSPLLGNATWAAYANATPNNASNSGNHTDIYDYDDDEPSSVAHYTAFTIVRYLFPVIVLVGTTGNALSAAVMLRRRMRTTSIYCYLLALAIVDTVVLYVSAFKTWFRLVSGIEWLHGSPVSCKTLMFLLLVALHLSAWLIVVVSADRVPSSSPTCRVRRGSWTELRRDPGKAWQDPGTLE